MDNYCRNGRVYLRGIFHKRALQPEARFVLFPSDACIAHPMHYNTVMCRILSHENANFDAVASAHLTPIVEEPLA